MQPHLDLHFCGTKQLEHFELDEESKLVPKELSIEIDVPFFWLFVLLSLTKILFQIIAIRSITLRLLEMRVILCNVEIII